MEKKGLSAFTYIVIFILLIFIFVGVYFFSDGFGKSNFKQDTILSTYEGLKFKSYCSDLCKQNEDEERNREFCCRVENIYGKGYYCKNIFIEGCRIDCEDVCE